MTTENNELKACCRCTAEFTPTRDWSNFCSPACRQAFHAQSKKEGQVLVPLIKAWTETRHSKPGSEEAAVCAWARQQITEIARMFIDEDEEEGRSSAVEYVKSLMDSGYLYVDRRRS